MGKKYLFVLAAGIAMACASAGGAGSPGTSHNANILTAQEIATTNVTNAFDAVQRLRPNFFRSHGATSISGGDNGLPTVYLNRQRYGDISTLKNIEAGAVREIHYYSPAEAMSRFSVGNPSGVIEVITEAR
jgi:hypothetical protein